MSSPSDPSLPISALQHWIFCPRQFALIHVERLWAENLLTAEGRLLHERTDAGQNERRGDVKILRAVQIACGRLGIHGVADVVELHGHPVRPLPIEYKRGRPKAHRADEVQLCAQALCLEEMFATSISEGALFYGQTRRRKSVPFNADLRSLTERVVVEARECLLSTETPLPIFEDRKCTSCSLKELCRPEAISASVCVDNWLSRMVLGKRIPE